MNTDYDRLRAKLEQNHADQRKLGEEQARLEALLEKEKELELRHGNYGICAKHADATFFIEGDGRHFGSTLFGNIFDELKQLKEPCEKFAVPRGGQGDICDYLSNDRERIVYDGRGYSLPEAEALAMYLRRCVLTVEGKNT